VSLGDGEAETVEKTVVESVARLPLEVEKVLALSLAIENERLGEVESVEKAPLEMVERTFALPLAIENESLEDGETENIEKAHLGMVRRAFALLSAIENDQILVSESGCWL
jgi:hypothetical protein